MKAKSKAQATSGRCLSVPCIAISASRSPVDFCAALMRSAYFFWSLNLSTSTGPSSAADLAGRCRRRAARPGARARGSACGSCTSGRPRGFPRARAGTARRRSGRTFPTGLPARCGAWRAGLGADARRHEFLEPGHALGIPRSGLMEAGVGSGRAGQFSAAAPLRPVQGVQRGAQWRQECARLLHPERSHRPVPRPGRCRPRRPRPRAPWPRHWPRP